VDGAGTALIPGATAGPPGPGGEELDGRLRAAGLRATAARRSVLGALTSLGGHRTADEVLVAVRAAGPPIARASVFNALRDLVVAGLALLVEVPGAARNEVAGPSHDHFVCRSCGRITDVERTTGAEPFPTPDLAGALVDEATVVFRGLCPDCAARRPPGAIMPG
jgi:Fur family transcriptional regulator, stress-responsive regulator